MPVLSTSVEACLACAVGVDSWVDRVHGRPPGTRKACLYGEGRLAGHPAHARHASTGRFNRILTEQATLVSRRYLLEGRVVLHAYVPALSLHVYPGRVTGPEPPQFCH